MVDFGGIEDLTEIERTLGVGVKKSMLGNGRRILDIGCGIGVQAAQMHQYGATVDGIDVCNEVKWGDILAMVAQRPDLVAEDTLTPGQLQDVIEACAERGFRLCNASALQWLTFHADSGTKYDLTYMRSFVHLVDDANLRELARLVAAITPLGGHVAIVNAWPQHPDPKPHWDHYPRSSGQIKKLFPQFKFDTAVPSSGTGKKSGWTDEGADPVDVRFNQITMIGTRH